MTAAEIIRILDLRPHPEGGHYRETFRDPATAGNGRSASTAIYFLLRAGEISRWHRVDAAEAWHWYAGASLSLAIVESGTRRDVRLGTDLAAGERPQRWCRRTPGSRRRASGPGRWWGAPWRPASNSPASSWRLRVSSRIVGRISEA
jgi:hypothetical protein